MSLNLMPVCWAMSTVNPQRWRAEPKATVPFAGSTFQFSFCSVSP